MIAKKSSRLRLCVPRSLTVFVASLVLLGVTDVAWFVIQGYRRQAAFHAVELRARKFTSGPNRNFFLGFGRWFPAFYELHQVEFHDRPITDDDLKVLRVLNEVSILNLENTPITDLGLGHLSDLRHLQWLVLSHTSVTDRGLEKLVNLPYLEAIDLSHTNVTDAGLMHLRGFKFLHDVDLTGTRVTDGGVAELQTSLPALKVTR